MKEITTALLLMVTIGTFAQIHNPVKWSTRTHKISDTEYELVATGIIDREWHLYSQVVPENGPIPTTFTFESNPNYLKKGNTKEEEGHTIDDKIFNMRIKYFDKKANFTQRIKPKTKDTFHVKATVEFMVCNDNQCLPPTEVDLLFEIK